MTTGRRATARAGASWELSVVYSDGVSAPNSSSANSPVSASSSTAVVLPVGSATVLDLVLPLLSLTALLRYCAIWVISYGFGCCASCGWSGPAYTLSLRSVLRPRAFFGSIPRTAFSTARSGWLAIRLA